jgi:outer membrane scaffolding protein for murein synthesis (MipA/OmpV family)
MKRRYTDSQNDRCRITISVLLLLFCLEGWPLLANAETDWSLTLGAGGVVSPLYSGSDKVGINPFPVIDVRYTTPHLGLFLSSLDGAGMALSNERIGMSFSLGVNMGGGRDTNDDDDDVKTLLQGTPEVKNPCRVFGSAGIGLPVGELSATANYFPIEIQYEDAAREGKTSHGILIETQWGMEIPLNSMMLLETNIGASWMNADYAEAYHSVPYQTPRLNEFSAKSGIRDVNASLTLRYLLTEHLGAGISGSATQLIGDAAESPLTKQDLQREAGLVVFYRF